MWIFYCDDFHPISMSFFYSHKNAELFQMLILSMMHGIAVSDVFIINFNLFYEKQITYS